MMLMSTLSLNVFAGSIFPGTKDEEIHLEWKYFAYDKDAEDNNTGAEVHALEAGKTYSVKLIFADNPEDENSTIMGLCLTVKYDAEAVAIPATGEKTEEWVYYTYAGTPFFANDGNGQLTAQLATTSGIKNSKNKIVKSGAFFEAVIDAKKDVTVENLKTLFQIDQSDSKNMIFDVNEKNFTIVECPTFIASVKTDAETLYTSSNAEKIANNLTGEIISADGTETPVTSGITVELNDNLTPGKNTVTAKYDGYTCDVEIDVVEDERDHLEVEGTCNLSYTSGQTLNLTGLTVYEVWKGGNRNVLAPDMYGTEPSRTTPLKVGTHNNQPLKIKLGTTLEVTVGTLTVTPANIDTVTIDAIGEKEYTGEQITPEPVVKAADGTALVKGTDYDVEYGTNIELGTKAGSVIIKGKGEYQGETTVYFAIVKATSPLTLTVNDSEGPVTISYGDSLTFKGNGTEITSTSAGIRVEYKTAGADDSAYTTYNNTPLNVGTYDFRAYRDVSTYYKDGPSTNTVGVTIKAKNIADLNFTVEEQTYGSTGKPTFTVEGFTLTEDTDYTLSGYENNTNAGSATFTITGNGNFYGSKVLPYTIKPKPLGANVIENAFAGVKTSEVVYTGNPYTPEVPESVTIGADTLVKGRDYTVEYTNNTNAGLATITITSKPGSNYTFKTINKTFTIKPKQIKINSSHYDWVSYVIDDEIDDYDLHGSPYFKYDGNPHGIKLQFKDDALVNGIKLETLVRITYTSETTRTNAAGYTTTVKLELKEDYKTNYQLLNGNDEVVQERPLSKDWNIHAVNLEPSTTAHTLNVLCDKLVETGTKQECTYDLSWLGATPKTIDVVDGSVSNFEYEDLDKSNMSNIKFVGVTAKAENTTGSIKLKLTFVNYNDYELTIPVKYINKKPVTVSMEKIEAVYGDSYTPVVMLGDKDVTANCTFTYNGSTEKPTNAGTYTVVATYSDNVEEDGYPGHTGTATATLTISQRPLTAKVTYPAITYGDAVDVTDANVCKVEFGNLVTGESLTKGTDFTVRTNYKAGDNVEGDYGFFITLDENSAVAKNYTVPTVTGTLTVNPKSLTAAMVEDVTAGLTYNGSAQTPTVTVKDGEKTLTSGTDYTLTYKNNTNAGTATVTVEGEGNYTGKVTKTFKIEKADPTITLVRAASVDYTGAQYSNKNVEVTKPSDIEVTYEYYLQNDTACTTPVKPIDAGSYKVRISFAGNDNYNAVQPTATVDFTINKVNHSISIAAASVTYTGAPYSETNITVTPTCEVTFTYYASETGTEPIAHPTDVGKYWVVASYAGTDNYNSSTSARVSFSITKATPPTPAEVKVDGEDKTLKDLEDSMRKDLGAIEGEFTWRDSDGKELPSNTKIEANKEYEWTFTPMGKDAKNYRPIYGKTTPYVRDDLSWLPGVINGGSTFNFRDVTRYDYFYNAVKWAAENGIASGTSRYTFSPDAVCTRAQTVTFLWRAAGSPMPSYRISPFTDVNYGDYYYNAVLWAVEQGITTGLTATTFGPDKTVTRGQVAMFLYRAASAVKPNITNSFTDVKSTAYNYDAILWAYDNRITTGTSTTTFSPDAFCTRAQIVTFLYRFYQGR